MWFPGWRLKITNIAWDFEKIVFIVPHPEKLRLKRECRVRKWAALQEDADLRPANYCNGGIRGAEKGHTWHRELTQEPRASKDSDKVWGVKGVLAGGPPVAWFCGFCTVLTSCGHPAYLTLVSMKRLVCTQLLRAEPDPS